MDTELHSRRLPDGCTELTLGRCLPVGVRPATCAALTPDGLFQLVGRLTLLAAVLRKMPDVDLPLKTGKFTETATGFVLADAEGSGRYDKLRVPRSFAFPEPD